MTQSAELYPEQNDLMDGTTSSSGPKKLIVPFKKASQTCLSSVGRHESKQTNSDMAPITGWWEGVAIIGACPLKPLFAEFAVEAKGKGMKILRRALFSSFQCWREIHLLLGPSTTHSSFLLTGITSLLHKRKHGPGKRTPKGLFPSLPSTTPLLFFLVAYSDLSLCCPFQSRP